MPGIAFANEQEAPTLISQLDAVESFIVGHEFGHVMRGDAPSGLVYAKSPGPKIARPRPVRRLATLGRDWLRELKADIVGQELMMMSARQKGMSRLETAITYLAPSLFFEIVDVIEDFRQCYSEGSALRLVPSDTQEQLLRFARQAIQNNRLDVGQIDAASLGCRQAEYPPAWLRGRLAFERAIAALASLPTTDDKVDQLAKALVSNARKLVLFAGSAIEAELAK
jgi:hypothetical protein